MSQKLRDLIRSVRACHTAAEERAVIQRESAAIRSAFKEGRDSIRPRNIMKLMYISMLGYSTEFGQMECVKMLAEQDFGCKRIGYLTITILMDETQEVLTLAENHIKKDLASTNAFTQGLALSAVGNIAGEDMARDVLHEVLTLVDSPNTHLKKKACLAALRIVRKVPEFAELFVEKLAAPFNERNHAALITTLSLMKECIRVDPDNSLQVLRPSVTPAVRMLKSLVLSSYASEYDIGGIADPCLQCHIIEYLRLLGRGNTEASEAMNDILAQVATNTESAKNVGSAILYECVRTIIEIEADAGLRVLGINILGRFLPSRDNNIRYVALQTLLAVVDKEQAAVQRHKPTIVDCLKDVDASIKRRAMDLIMALIDPENVRILVPDLIGYLSSCSDDMRQDMTERLCMCVERFAPSPEWRLETMLRLLKLPRSCVSEKQALRFISLATNLSEDSHARCVGAMWEDLSLPYDSSLANREALVLTGVWCLGEFIDVLAKKDGKGVVESVVSNLAAIYTSGRSERLKQYVLTSLTKIASKFPSVVTLVVPILETATTSLDCETQQRACEFLMLLTQYHELAKEGLDRMPAITSVTAIAPLAPTLPSTSPGGSPSQRGPGVAPKMTANFMDDIFAMDDTPAPPTPLPTGVPAAAPAAPVPAPKKTNILDIFGDDDVTRASAPVPAPAPATPASPAPLATVQAFDSAEIRVTIVAFAGSRPNVYDVEARLAAQNGKTLTDLQFLVAVPKTTKMDIKPLPSTTVQPSSPIVQKLVVDNTADSENSRVVNLRVKLVFKVNGAEVSHIFQSSCNV